MLSLGVCLTYQWITLRAVAVLFWEQLESTRGVFPLTSKQPSEVLHQHFNAVKLKFSYIERKGRSWYSSLRVQKMGSELVGVCAVFCESQGQPIQIFFSEHDSEMGFGVVLYVKGSF